MTSLNHRFLPILLVLVMLSGCKIVEPPSELLRGMDEPKHDFRGVWLATVGNLDWPKSSLQGSEEQQQAAIHLLDSLQNIGINAVFFQVRAESDAFYASSYDPWSYWLTGEQGRAPEPFYDPLFFMIREAHKRGMELHAWLNPFRVAREKGRYQMSGNHVSQRHPEWILRVPNENGSEYVMLNPGMPEVRDYISSIVADIVRRYDVDGIHFDDYFYPYLPLGNQDTLSFIRNGHHFEDMGDWRRDNINRLIIQVHDSLQVLAPDVVFGISPFAIRKNKDAGTNGMEGFHVLYADGLAWLENGSVDYLAPQLYFEPGNKRADYESLLSFWSDVIHYNFRHLYVGLAPYRLLPPHNWSREQAARQLLFNSSSPHVQGNIFFRAEHLIINPKGYATLISNELYRRPALTPVMPWKSNHPPPPVSRLTATYEPFGNVRLNWHCRDPLAVEERAVRYAIYRIDASSPFFEYLNRTDPLLHAGIRDDVLQAGYLQGITGARTFVDTLQTSQINVVYVVTAVSRNSIEGTPAIIQVSRDQFVVY